MKKNLQQKLSYLLLPLCLVIATACGGDNDDIDDVVVQEQVPVPADNEDTPSTRSNFNQRCRLANEVAGGNFDHDWAYPFPGQISRLVFSTTNNQVRLDLEGIGGETLQGSYFPVRPPAGELGSQGEFRYRDLSLFFPELPPGTIRGSHREYLIGKLRRGETALGTYLCPQSLLSELN